MISLSADLVTALLNALDLHNNTFAVLRVLSTKLLQTVQLSDNAKSLLEVVSNVSVLGEDVSVGGNKAGVLGGQLRDSSFLLF